MIRKAASILLGFVVLAGMTHAELVDGILATVDREVILHSDVMAEIAPLLHDLQAAAASQEEFDRQADKVMREALDQAIEQKILYRQALLAGLEIRDEDVESRLKKIIEQYDSTETFMRTLSDAGETMSDVRERLRKQIMAITMGITKRRELEKEAVVSEAETRQYYQDHQADFERPERVKVYRIFLAAGSGAEERAKARAQLEALRGEIALGAEFGDLARAHSDGPDADEGGLVGWVMRGDLVEDLETVVFSLEPGQFSDLVETEFGVHLLKAEEREDEGLASYDEVRTEIEPLLRARAADERYRKWMAELRKRSRVRVFQ